MLMPCATLGVQGTNDDANYFIVSARTNALRAYIV